MKGTIKFLEQLLTVAKKPDDVEWIVQLLFDIKKGR